MSSPAALGLAPWRCCAAAPAAPPNRRRSPCPRCRSANCRSSASTKTIQPALRKAARSGSGIGDRRQLDSAMPLSRTAAAMRRHDVTFDVAQRVEAQRIPGGIGARLAPPSTARNSQACRAPVAAAQHGEPARRRAMLVRAGGTSRGGANRLGWARAVERAGGVGRDGVEIVEQSDVNRHALCPFAPALS